MSKKNKNTLVPKLRFPEFKNQDGWEAKELNKLGKLVNGLTYSPDDVSEEGLLVLRSSNIQNGEIVLDDNVYVRPDVKGANLSEPNDILICVRNGSKALIGKNALIPHGMPLCTHGAFMTVFRSNNPKFVFQLFQTNAYAKKVAGDLGATINSINGSNFLKYEFLVPKNHNEQTKIAACLSSLDEVITAENQKLEVLKEHKKGLLQNLFPQEGETVPKVRFKEFENSGEWLPRPINKFINERSIIANNSLPLYSLTIENGITPKTERYERSFLVTDEENAYKVVESGDFAYNPMNLRFGAIARHSGENAVAVSKYYNIFFCDNSVDSAFCSFYFRSPKMIKVYDDIATGTLIEKRRVHYSNFLNLEVLLPSKIEQEKIAETLSSIDDLIIAQGQKIEALQLHKKGLLQGLFPQLSEP
ncbi:MAG: restriction endonuclease subunit S [Candidatus Kapabacteria bacterium]|nr:restriction endonuclease subunit S [Candidatus Kapabacteria bacterium]